jgi:hypothetical protein
MRTWEILFVDVELVIPQSVRVPNYTFTLINVLRSLQDLFTTMLPKKPECSIFLLQVIIDLFLSDLPHHNRFKRRVIYFDMRLSKPVNDPAHIREYLTRAHDELDFAKSAETFNGSVVSFLD